MDDLKHTAIKRWLIKAGNDMKTAKTMLAVEPPVTDTACFHAQQCVEKCLKAYLVHADVHAGKTHYLPLLVEMCGKIDPEFRSLEDTAMELTDYAVTGRYPDDWREIPMEEAAAAVEKAERTMTFVLSRLGDAADT